MNKRLTRSEVPIEQTWDLADLFESQEAWEAECFAVEQDLPNVTQYKGCLGENAQQLLACLHAQEALSQRLTKVFSYASLRASEDGSNPLNQANSAKVSSLWAMISASLSFIDSEILQLSDGTVERYLKEEPSLDSFSEKLIELLETKPHTLSPESEKVLASLGEVLGSPYAIYQRSKSSDIQFDSFISEQGEELPNSFALYENQYASSPDTELRRKAYSSFVAGLQPYKNTFAAVYATEVKKQVVLSRLRNYESVTHMLLHNQQVPLKVYHTFLDVIQAELAPHMRRMAKLKKRVLELDTLLHCDLSAPLDTTFNPSTTYEEASTLIKEALSIMGSEYMEYINNALSKRWIDLADNVGKSTGAFCSSPYGVHPYILVTWTNSMRDTFVLAHELGHGGHFSLAGNYQRMVNTRPSLFFIEAPSTMNELLLGHHILAKTTDPRMRRFVILQFLGTYYHNYVTHMLEAELQRRVYTHAEAGKPITATMLSDLKGDILADFWGDALHIDEGARLTWMRQPHYYMGLYPYTYSAGLTASTAVTQLIQEKGQPVIDRWLDVLKAGGTKKPLDLLQLAGVDLLSPDPIRKAVAYVGSLVDELEKSFE